MKFEEKQRKLYKFCYKLCKNSADSEDLVQNTFVKILRQGKPIDGVNLTYLKTAARHIYISERRAGKPTIFPLLPNDFANIYEKISINEENEKLAKLTMAFGGLTNNQKTTLQMYYFNKLKYKEIAILLNISYRSVKNNIVRGRAYLRRILNEC